MSPGTQVKGGNGSGESHPPRNSTAVKADIVRTATNSVRNCKKEKRGGVLDRIAGDELRFRLDQVERRPVRLGERENKEDDEHRQERQPIPAEEAEPRVLRANDLEIFCEPAHITTVTRTKPIDTS